MRSKLSYTLVLSKIYDDLQYYFLHVEASFSQMLLFIFGFEKFHKPNKDFPGF